MNQIQKNNNNAISYLENQEKLQLLKDTICKGSTDQEFQLFVMACKRSQLDPFANQIHAVKRWDNSLKREVMTIQVGIDGLRLIADRTGKYTPGREPSFEYDSKGIVSKATSYIMKQTADGKWHEVSACAHFKEYAATKKDGSLTNMWRDKPHVMLSKCAEAMALRKAFPADMAGLYTSEEMDQTNTKSQFNAPEPVEENITAEQVGFLHASLSSNPELKNTVLERLKKMGIPSLECVTVTLYPRICKFIEEEQKKAVEAELADTGEELEVANEA